MTEPSLRQLLHGPDAAKWRHATTLEIGRLAQGLPGVIEGTNTIRFVSHKDKPTDRISSYCRIVCAYNEHKGLPTEAIAVITLSTLVHQWSTSLL